MLESTKENQLLPNRWRQVINIMYEHKKIMGIRIKYLNGRNYLINSHSHINEYKVIEHKMLLVRNFFLKYSINGKDQILDKIKDNLISLRNIEREILPNLIKDIIE
jgi:hypothetical protein